MISLTWLSTLVDKYEINADLMMIGFYIFGNFKGLSWDIQGHVKVGEVHGLVASPGGSLRAGAIP